jgi:hypothetical protein
MECDHDDVGAACERRAVDDPQARRLDVAVQRRRADDDRGTAREPVTPSTSDAWKPSRQSLRTYSSVPSWVSFVTNATPLPAARSAATASTAPDVASSPTQTQPSRSSRRWS